MGATTYSQHGCIDKNKQSEQSTCCGLSLDFDIDCMCLPHSEMESGLHVT